MTFGLVDVSNSLHKGQAVKLTFFAPWEYQILLAINRYYYVDVQLLAASW